jgi:hypothetical protein
MQHDTAIQAQDDILSMLHANDQSVFEKYHKWSIFMVSRWAKDDLLTEETKNRLIYLEDECKESI